MKSAVTAAVTGLPESFCAFISASSCGVACFGGCRADTMAKNPISSTTPTEIVITLRLKRVPVCGSAFSRLPPGDSPAGCSCPGKSVSLAVAGRGDGIFLNSKPKIFMSATPSYFAFLVIREMTTISFMPHRNSACSKSRSMM